MARPHLAAIVAALVLASVAAQEVQFRGRTDLVSVFVTVSDAAGHLVTDLKEADFQIFDNGKRQPISLFTADVQPVSVVVMLDRSGSLAQESDWVREAAAEFIKRLLPADRARIGNFSTEIRISPQTFTNDHAVLTRILRDDLQPVGPSPVWTAVDRSITALLPEKGRRVVLLFSDGIDAPLRNQVKTDVKDVMYRAQYDEIMVYAIGVAGQQVSSQSTIHADRSGRLHPTTVYTTKPGKPDPNLKLLATESGGGYFELDPLVSLSALFARVADELHRQYWIGFKAGQLDHKVHKLEVKVLRSGLTVRARKSYVADPGR